jgi:hypothetical protein
MTTGTSLQRRVKSTQRYRSQLVAVVENMDKCLFQHAASLHDSAEFYTLRNTESSCLCLNLFSSPYLKYASLKKRTASVV